MRICPSIYCCCIENAAAGLFAHALRLVEGGTAVFDVCRLIGISEAAFYTWKEKYADLGRVGAAPFARSARQGDMKPAGCRGEIRQVPQFAPRTANDTNVLLPS
ncbi:MAG: transposase [Burkholderiaceae bacterium]|nr:transposase [Burkholderiaceae bacterium]